MTIDIGSDEFVERLMEFLTAHWNVSAINKKHAPTFSTDSMSSFTEEQKEFSRDLIDNDIFVESFTSLGPDGKTTRIYYKLNLENDIVKALYGFCRL